MDTSLTAALGLGFVLGLRHAMDADHVAAVSTLVSEHRTVTRGAILGAFWGAGHTVALLVAGAVVIALKLSISPSLEHGLEMLVAVVLMLLGGHVLLRALGSVGLHRHVHAHGGEPHSHFHLHVDGDGDHAHRHLFRLGRRPFLLGLVHGAAGSAALMLLALASISSPVGQLLYILVFGVGSTGGMLALSGLMGIPFAVAAGRSRPLSVAVQVLAGLSSLLVGAALMWELSGA